MKLLFSQTEYGVRRVPVRLVYADRSEDIWVDVGGLDATVTLDGKGGASAVQLDPELGQVGKPVASDGRLLDVLVRESYLPVVACVAGDARGAIFNVNGDQMAVACAQGFAADHLIFLTDVEGVRDGEGKTRSQLTIAAASKTGRAGPRPAPPGPARAGRR